MYFYVEASMTAREKQIEEMAPEIEGQADYCKGYRHGAAAAFAIADRERDLSVTMAYDEGRQEADRWWSQRWKFLGNFTKAGMDRIAPNCELPSKCIAEMDARAAEILGGKEK